MYVEYVEYVCMYLEKKYTVIDLSKTIFSITLENWKQKPGESLDLFYVSIISFKH